MQVSPKAESGSPLPGGNTPPISEEGIFSGRKTTLTPTEPRIGGSESPLPETSTEPLPLATAIAEGRSPHLQAGLSETTTETQAWMDGVDFSLEPLFKNPEGLNNYLLNQLSEQNDEKKSCSIILGKEYDGHTPGEYEMNIKRHSIIQQARKGDESAKKVYAVYSMHDNLTSTFAHVASNLTKLINREKKREQEEKVSIKSTEVEGWFFGNSVREIYSLGMVFQNHVPRLRALANQSSKEGRNATYWLIRSLLLRDTQSIRTIKHHLNKPDPVPSPFGDKWDDPDVLKILGTIPIDDLIKQMSRVAHEHSSPEQVILDMADKGNQNALRAYIEFYRDKKFWTYKTIAGQIRNKVVIPGLTPASRDWQPHMIEQFLKGEKITIEDPDSKPKLLVSIPLTKLELQRYSNMPDELQITLAMEGDMQAITERIQRLAESGLSYREIMEQLSAEGIQPAEKEEWDEGLVEKYLSMD